MQSYRIPIRRSSKWRNTVYLVIWVCYTTALITWPYTLPFWLKCTLIVVLGMTAWQLAHRQFKQAPDMVFLSEQGDIGFDAQSPQVAKLSQASFVSLHCVKLYFKGQLDQRGQWLTLYSDQVANADMSRLKRIIYRVRKQQD